MVDWASPRRLDDVSRALDRLQPALVVHLAFAPSARLLWLDNELVTRALANAVMAACPDAILTVFGSAAEYGPAVGGRTLSENHACHPVSTYGLSKLAATRAVLALVEQRGLRANIVRPLQSDRRPAFTCAGAWRLRRQGSRGAPSS